MPSIEILVNPQIRPLLHKYKQLLRADMDTFPTPRMRDYYIDHIYMVRLSSLSLLSRMSCKYRQLQRVYL